jgi:bacterial microcompartment shell protein
VHPALLLLELDSIAQGIRIADAMAKRSPLPRLLTGTVHPGRFLVLAAGGVGEVKEAQEAAQEADQAAGAGLIRAQVFLPAVHPRVLEALEGTAEPWRAGALGVLETTTVPAVLSFADGALKGAEVTLAKLGLADGLGGKGYALLTGEVHDVEAAMELGLERLEAGGLGDVVARVLIPQLDPSMIPNLTAPGPFFQGLVAPGRA